jgi:hypothetical protein
MKYVRGGKQVLMGEKPELLPLGKDPHDYDIIFIGTPVWAFRHTPAVESFLCKAHLKNKKIALFCCHGGGRGMTLEKMKRGLAGNDIIGEIDFNEPLSRNKDAHAERARAWAQDIILTSK